MPNSVVDVNDITDRPTAIVYRRTRRRRGPLGRAQRDPAGHSPPPRPAVSRRIAGRLRHFTYPLYWYNNPVRAGRSVYDTALAPTTRWTTTTTRTDPLLDVACAAATYYYNPPASATPPIRSTFVRGIPEPIDYFDGAGQIGRRLRADPAVRHADRPRRASAGWSTS